MVVEPGSGGEGLPYAPKDWPNDGDIWRWRAGYRITDGGYYQDRALIAPNTFPKGGRKPRGGGSTRFDSISSLKSYIQLNFPDQDLDSVFASFSWRIPAAPIQSTNISSQEEKDGTVKKRKHGTVEKKGKYKAAAASSLASPKRRRAAADSSTLEQKAATSSSPRLEKKTKHNLAIYEEKFDEHLKTSQPGFELTSLYETPVVEVESEGKLKSKPKMDSSSMPKQSALVASSSTRAKLITYRRKTAFNDHDDLLNVAVLENIGDEFNETSGLEDGIHSTTQETTSGKAFESLKDKAAKVGELNEQVMWLQKNIDDSLLVVQDINDQIALLQKQRNSLAYLIDSMEKKKECVDRCPKYGSVLDL